LRRLALAFSRRAEDYGELHSRGGAENYRGAENCTHAEARRTSGGAENCLTRRRGELLEARRLKRTRKRRCPLLDAHRLRVVVELKSVEERHRKYSMKVRTYIRLLNLPVGLLINFGGETLKEGLRRIVNNLAPSESPSLRVNHRVEPAGALSKV
jgi:hypothetical protein